MHPPTATRVTLAALAAFWAMTCLPPAAAAPATPSKAPERIPGCQGEACGCFYAYDKEPLQPGPNTYPIPTWRPIDLRTEPDKASPVLAHFAPGTMARPLQQFIVVRDRGAYVVTGNPGKVKGLRRGDRLELLLYQGEGSMTALKGGRLVGFDDGEVTLKVLRATRTEEWSEVQVGKRRGFTPGSPFQGCLE